MDAGQSRYWENHTAVTEFILLGYPQYPAVQFVIFLITYMAILLGNGVILVVITLDPALHTPMYFFLRSLSGLEICYTSVTLPRMMVNVVSEDRSISMPFCALQMLFLIYLGTTESYLLLAMAYDRYLAICLPLRYMTIMSYRVRVGLVVSSFAITLPLQLLVIWIIFSLPFCGSNEIDHFYCDVPPILSLACADIYASELAVATDDFVFVVVPFFLILISYVYITRTILRMPSGTGRKKAFSTCSSHLTGVSLFYGSGILAYMMPQTPDFVKVDKFLSVVYAIIVPLFNPVIYTLRNREVKAAFARLLNRTRSFKEGPGMS